MEQMVNVTDQMVIYVKIEYLLDRPKTLNISPFPWPALTPLIVGSHYYSGLAQDQTKPIVGVEEANA